MVVGTGAGVNVVRERHYETFVFVTVPSRECIALVMALSGCTGVATDIPVDTVRLINTV